MQATRIDRHALSRKVDEPALGIGAQERDLKPIPNVETVLAAHQAALHERVEDADEDAFGDVLQIDARKQR